MKFDQIWTKNAVRLMGVSVLYMYPSWDSWMKLHLLSYQSRSLQTFPVNSLLLLLLFSIYTAECPSEGNLTASRGMLWSPGFPRSYPDNAFCVWVITAPRGEQVKLVLQTVDLEYCTLCHCDYIEVRDGARPDGKLIGRFCKTNKTVVYSEGMQIWVKFKSDSTNKRRGFLANFSRLKLGKSECVHDYLITWCFKRSNKYSVYS